MNYTGLRSVIDLIIGNDLSEQVILEEFVEAQVRATELDQWEPRSEADKGLERETAIQTLGEELKRLRPPREAPIVVGHNLGWDFAFLIEAFLHPLPDTLAEFVRTVDSIFPRLLDTRILAANHSAEFRDLDLSAIHAILAGEGDRPRCYWDPGKGYRTGSAHNAGYDSKYLETPPIGAAANITGTTRLHHYRSVVEDGTKAGCRWGRETRRD